MKTILDNSNIVESYPGITLPLTTSFIETAYHNVFSGSVLRLTGDDQVVREIDENLHHMVVNYQGRIYYNLNSWYAVLSLFPFHNRIKSIWRQMLGVTHQDMTASPVCLSLFEKARVISRIRRSGISLPSEMKQLDADFSYIFDEFYAQDIPQMSNDELVQTYNKLKSDVVGKWEVTLANDMYTFIYTWLVEKHVKQARTYLSNLLNVESMHPIRALLDLTELAVKNGEIAKLKTLTSEVAVRKQLETGGIFYEAMQEYIVRYGDRYLEELKLESATYRTKYLLLVQAILDYADDAGAIKQKLRARAPVLPKTSFLGRLYLRRAVLGIKNRETSRMNRSRLYGMVRVIFLQMGDNLQKQGIINKSADIFYLTVDEVIGGDLAEAKERISERKREYQVYGKQTLANRIVLEDGKVATTSMVITQTGAMSGIPVSTGIVEGEVLVVDDPKTVGSTKGKILVTKTTDPGWVFLLVNAKGIISEKGSLLSHTAIISRELSIPAVVGVANATNRLYTGQHIVLNGDTGTIEVIDV